MIINPQIIADWPFLVERYMTHVVSFEKKVQVIVMTVAVVYTYYSFRSCVFKKWSCMCVCLSLLS